MASLQELERLSYEAADASSGNSNAQAEAEAVAYQIARTRLPNGSEDAIRALQQSLLTRSRPNDAQLQAIGLEVAQGLFSGPYYEFLKYQGMYNKYKSLVNSIQRSKGATRKAILLGAIKDTGNPKGTAINLALNAKTVVDAGISKKVAKEYGLKIITALGKMI